MMKIVQAYHDLALSALSVLEKESFMTLETFLFYLFSSIALMSGVMVIRSRNPVHSVLFLILVFCNAAGLLILLDLDFFAMIFLVVYVGAIAVLFLFVVMMLHIKFAEIHENVLRYLPVGGLLGFIFLFEVLLVVENDFIPVLSTEHLEKSMNGHQQEWIIENLKKISSSAYEDILEKRYGNWSSMGSSSSDLQYIQWPSQMDHMTNIEGLGQLLYTYYFYFFILASLILLIAMIGAIVLTMHKGLDVKRQEVYEQNTREFSKTVRKFRDGKNSLDPSRMNGSGSSHSIM